MKKLVIFLFLVLTSSYFSNAQCTDIQAPYLESFESGSVLNPCWTAIIENPNIFTKIEILEEYRFSRSKSWGELVYHDLKPITGNQFFRFANQQSNGTYYNNYFVTPRIIDLDNTKRVRFKLVGKPSSGYNKSFSSSNVVIGTMSNPNDQSTFSPLDTIPAKEIAVFKDSNRKTFDWKEHTIYLENFTGTDEYIALKHEDGGFEDNMFLEDFQYEQIPNCTEPLYPKTTETTYNTASIEWETYEYSTSNSYEIEYGLQGFALGTGTQIVVNSTEAILSNLSNDDTTYEFYVRSVCGVMKSEWSVKTSFKTSCYGVSIGYTENFDSYSKGFVDNCWTAIIPQVDLIFWDHHRYLSIENHETTTNETAHSEPNTLLMWNVPSHDVYNDDVADHIILVSPRLLDFDNYKKVSFWVKEKYTGSSGRLKEIMVGTLSDPNDQSTFEPFQAITDLAEQDRAWTRYTVDFSDYYGTNEYVGIKQGTTNGNQELYFDDFEYSSNTCITPTAVNLSLVDDSSVNLLWQDNNSTTPAESWEIEYGVTGFQQGTGTITNVTSNPYTLSGLEQATTYDVYVRGNCGAVDGFSDWSEIFTFRTTCSITSGYFQGFENQDNNGFDDSDCWTFNGHKNFADVVIEPYEDEMTTVSSLAAHNNQVSTLLVTPFLADMDQNKIIKFKLRDDFAPQGVITGLVVGTMSNPLDEASFTPYQTIPYTEINSTLFTEFLVDFASYTGSDNYIAFRAENSLQQSDYLHFDDFQYIDKSTNCISPYQITKEEPTATEVQINWKTYDSSYSGYELEIGLENFTKGSGTVYNTSDLGFKFSGLEPNTYYHYYIRTECSSGSYSDWSGPFKFRTLNDVTLSLPWIENFDSLPELGWELLPNGFTGYTDDKWISHNGQYLDYGHAMYPHHSSTGSNYIYMDSDYPSWLITPSFNLEKDKKYMFLYDYINTAVVEDIELYCGLGKNISDMQTLLDVEYTYPYSGLPDPYHYTVTSILEPSVSAEHTFGIYIEDDTSQQQSNNVLDRAKVSFDRFQLIDNIAVPISENLMEDLQGESLNNVGFDLAENALLQIRNDSKDKREFLMHSKNEDAWVSGERQALFDLNPSYISEISYKMDITYGSKSKFKFKWRQRGESYYRILINDQQLGYVGSGTPNYEFSKNIDLEAYVGQLVDIKIQVINSNDRSYIRNPVNGHYFSDFEFIIAEPLPLTTPAALSICDDGADGVEIFDLTTVETELLEGYNRNYITVSYYLTELDSKTKSNAVDPLFFENTSSPQTIYVLAERSTDGARGTAMITVELKDEAECISDMDGDGIKDIEDSLPNDPCLPLQNKDYTGYDALNIVWQNNDCDGDTISNGDEVTAGTNPYFNESLYTDSTYPDAFGEQRIETNDGGARAIATNGTTVVAGIRNATGSKVEIYAKNASGVWEKNQELTSPKTTGTTRFGQTLALSENTLIVSQPYDDENLPDTVFIYQKDANETWVETQQIEASSFFLYDGFGSALAVSGNTMVIAANGIAPSGAVYVFEKNMSNVWVETAELYPSDDLFEGGFGESVAVSGNQIIIGASGNDATGAFIFEKQNNSTWQEIQKLSAPDGQNYTYARDVAITENRIVIGDVAYTEDVYDKGETIVYEKSYNGLWSEVQTLKASNGYKEDYFGDALAMNDNRIVVNMSANQTDTGWLYVYHKSGGEWTETHILTDPEISTLDFGNHVAVAEGLIVATSGDYVHFFEDASIVIDTDGDGVADSEDSYPNNPCLPSQIATYTAYNVDNEIWATSDCDNDTVSNGEEVLNGTNPYDAETSVSECAEIVSSDGAASDYFGKVLAMSDDGNILAVSAYYDDDQGDNSGSVYIFNKTAAGAWEETQKLNASDGSVDDNFGFSLTFAGESLAISTYQQNNRTGAVYIYDQSATGDWQESQKLLASDSAFYKQFGYAIAGTENQIVIGAPNDNENGANAGAAYIFEKGLDGIWMQTKKLVASDVEAYDSFGISVSIATNIAVVGSFYDDDVLDNSGAAYVFDNTSNGNWTEVAKLKATDPKTYSGYAVSVANTETDIIVGAASINSNSTDVGAAYVYKKSNDGSWISAEKLTPEDGIAKDKFGLHVAINENRIACGISGDDDNGPSTGSVQLFYKSSNEDWIAYEKLLACGTNGMYAAFGNGLALGKNSLAAGTTLFTANGSAYVFELGDVPIVTEPLVVQLIQTASSGCSELGATIEVTATGGMEPYTYAMYDATSNSLIGSGVTNAFENVPMGTYYVQVTDSNSIQERSNSVSITESEAITATVTVNDISCESDDNGSISIEASGGIAPLQYSIGDGAFYFQPNFENLTSGNYDITIQDANGCAFHTSVSIAKETGCSDFTLPVNNFTIETTSESCASSNNGSIVVSALETLDYTATLSDGMVNESKVFKTFTSFKNLEAGSYDVCITVAGEADFEKCFTIQITEPDALKVDSKTDSTGKLVSLSLKGSSSYFITVNEKEYSTTENEITLPLSEAENNIMVKTDLECQGVFEQTIIATRERVSIFPNPVEKGDVSIFLPSINADQEILITMFSQSSIRVLEQMKKADGRIVKINMDNLPTGVYTIIVTSESQNSTHKIIKK